MVSVMITNITITIDTMAAASKVGAPKWNGVEIAKPWACETFEKSTLPNSAAIRPPATSPIRIAIREKNPGRKRYTSRMMAKVAAASAMLDGGPKSGVAGTATGPADGHREQRDTDHRDDRPGDHRRKEMQ